MFDLPSLRIGRLFGIPIEINASWLLIFALVAVTLSFTYFPTAYPGRSVTVDVVSGLVTSVLFFVSIVLHEMAHSLVSIAGGGRISKITLFVFGGVAQMEEEPEGPGKEFVMALAGPGMSVALAALSFAVSIGMSAAGLSNVWTAPVQYLAWINVAVAVFNMAPGFPLDGGRVFRSILWKLTGDPLKATRWASGAGQLIGWLLIGLAVVGLVRGTFDYVWFGVIGWFLTTMAKGAYRQEYVKQRLHRRTVRQEMSSPVVVAPGGISLAQMADEYFLGGKHPQYPVVEDGRFLGLLHMDDLREVPRERWGSTRVADVVRDGSRARFVSPDTPVDEVLPELGSEGGALLVVSDGRLEGIITRSDVIRALRSA